MLSRLHEPTFDKEVTDEGSLGKRVETKVSGLLLMFVELGSGIQALTKS